MAGDHAAGAWLLVVVCPIGLAAVTMTELAQLAQVASQFDARNCKLLAVTDVAKGDLRELLDNVHAAEHEFVTFPVLTDVDGDVCNMLHACPPFSDVRPARCTLLFDDTDALKLSTTYPGCVGRNFNEVLRVLDALQLMVKYDVHTPSNWCAGDSVLVAPHVGDADAAAAFPKGVWNIKPYLRVTPAPDR